MTETITTQIELDPEVAHWLDVYADAARVIALEEQRQTVARERITTFLGDREIGTIDGVPRVRYTTITSRRLDPGKARAILTPDELAQCTTVSTTRRFVVVRAEDGAA